MIFSQIRRVTRPAQTWMVLFFVIASICAAEASPKLVKKHRAAAEAAWKRHDLETASAEWSQVFEAAQEVGPNDVPTLSALYEAAWFFYRLGRLDKAELILNNGLSRLDEGGNHGRVYKGLFRLRLGNVYLDTGRLDLAEHEFREAVQLFHFSLYLAHPLTVEALVGQGRVQLARRDFDQAEKSLKDALQWINHPHSARNPTRSPFDHYTREAKYKVVARTQSALGELYETKQDYEQAEERYRENLKLLQREYGKKSAELAPGLIALARVTARQDKFQEAEEQLERALTLTEKGPGEARRHAWAAADLGLLYHRNAQTEKVDRVTMGVIQHDERLPASFPVYAIRVAEALGKENGAEAFEFLEGAIETHQKQFGSANAGLISVWRYAAGLAREKEQPERAVQFTRELITALEKQDGREALTLVEPYLELGRLHAAQKNLAEAEKSFQRQLAIMEKHFGAEDTRVANALDDLAAFYTVNGQSAEATEAARRANEIRVQSALKR